MRIRTGTNWVGKQGNAHPKPNGFTLTDLLATIAACTVLLAMALPSLGTARESNRGAVCYNNLRQMGLASNAYAAENRDSLTLPNWDGGNATTAGWLYQGVIPKPDTVTNLSDAYKSGLWFPYVRTPASYLCPADRENSAYASRPNRLSSYVMNGATCSYGTLSTPRKVTDAWSPNCYLLWHPDANLGTYVFNDAAAYPDASRTPFEGVGALHVNGQGEVLTVAGNIRLVTAMTFRAESQHVLPQGGLANW